MARAGHDGPRGHGSYGKDAGNEAQLQSAQHHLLHVLDDGILAVCDLVRYDSGHTICRLLISAVAQLVDS